MSQTMPPPPPPPPMNTYDPHRLEANGRYPAKPESRGNMVVMGACHGITNFLLGAVTFSGYQYATSLRSPLIIGNLEVAFLSSYSQHIYLCVTGYVILMCQAMLVFNPNVGWTSTLQIHQKRLIHIAMQVTGSVLAITGSIIKMMDSDPNFHSAHSVLGFIALILTVVSLIGGLVNFMCCQLSESMALWKILHACFGCLTVSVALIAMAVVYFKYFSDNLSGIFAILALVALIISMLLQILKRF